MNEEEKELLQKTYELSEENNKILHGIRSSNRWSMFFRVFYWLVIIGISIGAFVYLQPYIDKAMGVYKVVQTDLNAIKSVTSKIPGIK